jgi:hypothetical protein
VSEVIARPENGTVVAAARGGEDGVKLWVGIDLGGMPPLDEQLSDRGQIADAGGGGSHVAECGQEFIDSLIGEEPGPGQHVRQNSVEGFGPSGIVMEKGCEPRMEPWRPRRADARRNYDLLLDAAKRVFDERGLDAPLDDIARLAGVGNATMYRHFPTRRELITAVYADEVTDLCAHGEALLGEEAPGDGLFESWTTSFSLVNRRSGFDSPPTPFRQVRPAERRFPSALF